MIWKEYIFILSTILIFKVFTFSRVSDLLKNLKMNFRLLDITCTVLVLLEKKTCVLCYLETTPFPTVRNKSIETQLIIQLQFPYCCPVQDVLVTNKFSLFF